MLEKPPRMAVKCPLLSLLLLYILPQWEAPFQALECLESSLVAAVESSLPRQAMSLCKNGQESQTSKEKGGERYIIKSVYGCKHDQRHRFIPGWPSMPLKTGMEWNIVYRYVNYCKILPIDVCLVLGFQRKWIGFSGYFVPEETPQHA